MTTRDMKALLTSAGVTPGMIVQSRETKHFVTDFFAPEMQSAIEPAAVYAERIRQAVPQARIVSTYNTYAEWREGQPVINAMVIFEVKSHV